MKMPDERLESAMAWYLPERLQAGSAERLRLEQEVVDLFDQFREPLLRYLLGMGLPVQDGEEIIQETFLALFQHLRAGKDRRNLRAWLFRVAHNLGLRRRNGNQRDMASRAEADAWLADPAPTPEAQCAMRQRQQVLEAVVGALGEQDRQCLLLRAAGLRYREIARVLDISLGAVSLYLHRALARVTRAVER